MTVHVAIRPQHDIDMRRSLAKCTASTSPTFRPLYWTCVFPACTPLALWKVTVTAGPVEAICLNASHATMAIAARGIDQIQPGQRLVCSLAGGGSGATRYSSACGAGDCGGAWSGSCRLLRVIPEQAGIEDLRGEHRQHNHCQKRRSSSSGCEDTKPPICIIGRKITMVKISMFDQRPTSSTSDKRGSSF